MAKKMKLSLESLRVKSFVTSLNQKEEELVKGGTSQPPTGPTNCDTICDWTEQVACTIACETDECPNTDLPSCAPE